MATSEDLINFDVIETQKENIQSLPAGRSARSLANLFSPSPLDKTCTPTPSDTRNLNDLMRQEFEAEILSISESDDPLDIYDRYVKWTLDAYPSAQATPQSQLLPLLERATKAFLTSSHYKNDPRYLKLWLQYIRLFSDSPRETYAFLARHSIGEGLALFYEEFAAWLEGAGRWHQADEVYKMGVEKEARPVERLMRKYADFKLRLAQHPEISDEPSSPALPTVRPALAAKVDPFAASTPRPVDPQAPPTQPAFGGRATSRSGRSKMSIFSDADAPAPAANPASGGPSHGWENIGSLADRKKENTMEAKPWVGETLKTGKTNSGAPKLMVFKDESLPQSSNMNNSPSSVMHQQQVINPRTGRAERVFVDLEAVYPNREDPTEEMSFEELRALRRGWMSRDWSKHRTTQIEPPSIEQELIVDEPCENEDSIDAIGLKEHVEEEATDEHQMPVVDDDQTKEGSREGRTGRPKKLKVMEVKGETQTVRTNLDSPSGPKLKRKTSAEPTMTFHTRAATDEIYDIFNQPLKSAGGAHDEESGVYSEDEDDDYTSAGESTGTGRISGTSELGETTGTEVKSVSEWSEFTARKHLPHLDDGEHTGTADTTGVSEAGPSEGEGGDYGDCIPESCALVTPTSPEPAPLTLRTKFVPIPPVDYEPPTRPYRDPSEVEQNRLPFMTPIVEKTESSLAPSTAFAEKDYFNSKTPSRGRSDGTPALPVVEGEELWSSPFQELINEAKPTNRPVPSPALTKLANPKPVAAPRSKTARSTAPKEAPLSAKGPIIKEIQCNPVDDAVRTTILENLHPPLSTYDGFSDHRDQNNGRSGEIRRFTKALAKMSKGNSNDKTATNLAMPPVLSFDGVEETYTLKRELGKGAFAPVYLVESSASSSHNVGEDEDEDGSGENRVMMGKGAFGITRKPLEALKMEEPPTPWEFYMMRQARRRLGVSRAAESIIHAYEMHLFRDECYLIEEYRDQGTLLDLVNDFKAEGAPGMDETLVIFFAVELFRVVEGLHSKGLLHGDLKADNCLVRFDGPAGSDAAWSPHYTRSGADGWSAKGLSLIDFGRGIDMRHFVPEVGFIADWPTGPQDCAEMREMRPWTYQIDYHGLAGILHSCLFGRYIDTVVDRSVGSSQLGSGATKTYRLVERFKRYWQVELWTEVFGLLLNPLQGLQEEEEGGRLPRLRGLRRCRERLEDWLEGNFERGVGLKGLVRRMEERIRERRR
ncbi:MAG: hypothetical protein M1817_002113 [Caeruleum heppii]|nr:MAG: hypothetical protein M1817_002113 [Caeruleum heppii]